MGLSDGYKKPVPGEYPPYSHIYLDLVEDDDNVLEPLLCE